MSNGSSFTCDICDHHENLRKKKEVENSHPCKRTGNVGISQNQVSTFSRVVNNGDEHSKNGNNQCTIGRLRANVCERNDVKLDTMLKV